MKRGPAYLAVLLAAFLPQLDALTCGFALDDFGLIVHNQAVRSLDLPLQPDHPRREEYKARL